jgi:hypothetical protein
MKDIKNLAFISLFILCLVGCTKKKESDLYDSVDANKRFSEQAKKDISQLSPEFYESHAVPDLRVDGDIIHGGIVQKTLDKISKTTEPEKKIQLLSFLGSLLVTRERTIARSLDAYNHAMVIARDSGNQKLADQFLAKIGIVHLRMGELANCAKNHNRDSCIFPISALARHKDKAGSQAALKIFTDYLSRHPEDIHIQWLANVARLTLGDPQGKKWMEEHQVLKAGAPFPRFLDLSSAIGLIGAEKNASFATLAEDFNGDGLLDILGFDNLRYMENDGRGRFVNKTVGSGLEGQKYVFNLTPTDYDNDGKVDIYISRRRSSARKVYNSLIRNEGKGKFKDVTEAVGLKFKPNINVAAQWADFDNDGWLDLFVCNENREPDLFHNQKGHFTNVIKKSGIMMDQGFCGGATWGDVNNDGHIDLFLSNFAGENQLYINQKDGTFKRSSQEVFDHRPQISYGTWFFDYDNDGWLDLFIVNFDQNVGHMIEGMIGKKNAGDHQRIFRNKGDGIFEDTSVKVGLNTQIMTMGGNFGDLNNDGYPEIYLGTGGHSYGDLVPNRMFLNQQGKHFADISEPGGFANLQKGHGVTFTDLDNDGQQDVLISLGGAYEADFYFPQLLHNPGFKNHWLTLRLKGTKSNAAAIGARVKARFTENNKIREVYQTCGKGGTFGANSLQVHLGLGKASQLDSIEILWPGETSPEKFTAVGMDAFYSVQQGSGKLKKLDLPRIKFPKDEKAHLHHLHSDR